MLSYSHIPYLHFALTTVNSLTIFLRHASAICLLYCNASVHTFTHQHLVCIPWLPPFLSLGRGAVYKPLPPSPKVVRLPCRLTLLCVSS